MQEGRDRKMLEQQRNEGMKEGQRLEEAVPRKKERIKNVTSLSEADSDALDINKPLIRIFSK